jgi:hypothetical protein
VSRIGQQHIRGNARSSTFRLTISVLLLEQIQGAPISLRDLALISDTEPARQLSVLAILAEKRRCVVREP